MAPPGDLSRPLATSRELLGALLDVHQTIVDDALGHDLTQEPPTDWTTHNTGMCRWEPFRYVGFFFEASNASPLVLTQTESKQVTTIHPPDVR